MNDSSKHALKYGAGSVGETARAYATSYARMIDIITDVGLTKDVNSIEDFTSYFISIFSFRNMAYERLDVDDKNLMFPFCITGIEKIHEFFANMEKAVSAKTGEAYDDFQVGELKLDMPTMILYAMLMESGTKRKGFAAADKEFTEEALKVLYREVKAICPYQSFFTEEEFITENINKVNLFLLEVEPSLAMYIRASMS